MLTQTPKDAELLSQPCVYLALYGPQNGVLKDSGQFEVVKFYIVIEENQKKCNRMTKELF